MPPRKLSRHSFAQGIQYPDEPAFLTDREPFLFRVLDDSTEHLVRRGDTLYSLAGAYYHGFFRPSGLWWVIADFQPQPVHDPTITLTPGSVMIIPSPRTVQEQIFTSQRRLESNP